MTDKADLGMGGWLRERVWEQREEAERPWGAGRGAFLLAGLAELWQVEAGGGVVLPGGADSAGLEDGCDSDSRERQGCLWTHPRGGDRTAGTGAPRREGHRQAQNPWQRLGCRQAEVVSRHGDGRER